MFHLAVKNSVMQIKECNMLEVRDERDGELSGEQSTVSCWV